MQVTVTEARKRWSEILNRVALGETVSISRRGKVVARFVPEREPERGAGDPLKRAAATAS